MSELCNTCSEQVTCAILNEVRNLMSYHIFANPVETNYQDSMNPVVIIVIKCCYYVSGV